MTPTTAVVVGVFLEPDEASETMMSRFFWICFGGAAGTGARYVLSGWALRALGTGFPYGTLAVNVLGSFAVGLLMQVGLTTPLMSPTLRLSLTTGVMGGFTTYSTFNYETIRYIQDGAWLLAVANVGVTLLACLAAGFAGLAVGRALIGG
jgi:fluoride exporter